MLLLANKCSNKVQEDPEETDVKMSMISTWCWATAALVAPPATPTRLLPTPVTQSVGNTRDLGSTGAHSSTHMTQSLRTSANILHLWNITTFILIFQVVSVNLSSIWSITFGHNNLRHNPGDALSLAITEKVYNEWHGNQSKSQFPSALQIHSLSVVFRNNFYFSHIIGVRNNIFLVHIFITLQSKSRLVPLYAANTILPTIPAPSFMIQVMVAARGVASASPTPRPPSTAAVARLPEMEEENAWTVSHAWYSR